MTGFKGALRPYQKEAHAALFAAWGIAPWAGEGLGVGEQVRSTLLDLCTGAGKTVIACAAASTIVEDLGERLLFIADTHELTSQPMKKIKRFTNIFPSLEQGSHRASLNADVVVASAQTLCNPKRLARWPKNHFKFILNDECHRGVDRFKKINDYFENAYIAGLTGTAFRTGLVGKKPTSLIPKWYQSCGFRVAGFGKAGLIEAGYLTDVRPYHLDIEADISTVDKDASGDYNAEQLGNVMAPLMRQVAKAIKADPLLKNMQILCFLPLVRSSEAFVKICREEGLTAEHCDGKTDNRELMVSDFEAGKFQILANSQVFGTGVDFINCNALLNLCPTRSIGAFKQRLGRIMRVLEGVIDGLETAQERLAAIAASRKPFALVIDILYQLGKLGLVDMANMLSEDEGELAMVRKAMREKKSPVDLEEMRRLIQAEREQKVIDQWTRTKGRARELISMEVFSAIRHDARIAEYEPFNDAEARPLNKANRWALQARGIDPDTVPTQGLASLIIDTLNDSAPHHAWAALRAHGHPNPERMTLNDSIRALRDGFPMGLGGDRYLGKPFREVPLRFWERCYDEWRLGSSWMDNYPAEKRYMRKIVETARGSSPALVQKQLSLV